MFASLTNSSLSRRTLLGAAGIGLGAAVLAGCGGPSVAGPGASSSPSADPAGPDFAGVSPAKSITFWSNHPGSSEAITQEIIAAFTAKEGIEVKLVTAGSNYEEVATKFQAAQAGGQLPDIVVFSDVWWFRYFLADSIIPLGNALKAAEVDTADYRQGAVRGLPVRGRAVGRAVGPFHAPVLLQQEPLAGRRTGGSRTEDVGRVQ
jgi:sn-glycerol 3-phosphate transport system substrate-binding protein